VCAEEYIDLMITYMIVLETFDRKTQALPRDIRVWCHVCLLMANKPMHVHVHIAI